MSIPQAYRPTATAFESLFDEMDPAGMTRADAAIYIASRMGDSSREWTGFLAENARNDPSVLNPTARPRGNRGRVGAIPYRMEEGQALYLLADLRAWLLDHSVEEVPVRLHARVTRPKRRIIRTPGKGALTRPPGQFAANGPTRIAGHRSRPTGPSAGRSPHRFTDTRRSPPKGADGHAFRSARDATITTQAPSTTGLRSRAERPRSTGGEMNGYILKRRGSAFTGTPRNTRSVAP